MAIAPFLAMTAAEFCAATSLPSKIAWMACHFSPYATGLSNLPKELPPGSLLMVDDITPPHGHDPVLIAEQLTMCVEALQCCGVLLDFQRDDCDETQSIAEYLAATLPCPTAVSECYASKLDCGVFLPPLLPSMALQEYLAPWKSREIWLELSTEGEILTVTERGTGSFPFPSPASESTGFCDEKLHCHYTTEVNEKSARFTLWRTKKDLKELLEEMEALGVAEIVGLYQEIQDFGEQKASPRGSLLR